MAGELRLGLIGAGRWGRNYIRTVEGLPGLRLAALASRNPQSAQWLPEGCALQGDWRALLDRREVDAIVVATPTPLHAEMAQAAVAAGLPVLVEKPLTLDSAHAIALRDFVAARRGFVMVDHTHLFNPAYRALKHAAPRYGAIRAVVGRAGNLGPFRPDTTPLWDWGAHDVALCLDLLGYAPDSIEVDCLESRMTPEGLGQSLEVRATFPGPVPVRLRLGNIDPKARRLAVHLDRGVLVYDDLADHQVVAHAPYPPQGEPAGAGEPLPYEREQPLRCVVREFAAAVRGGSRSTRDLELGVDVVRVLERAEATLAVA